MDEEVQKQLEQINKEVTPFLDEKLNEMDYTPVIIYFAGLLRTLMDDYNNEDANRLIIQFLANGEYDVSL